MDVDAGGDGLRMPALEEVGDLAVLGGDDAREFFASCVEELVEGEHHLGAARQRHASP
jgi:hypothetical protein